MFNALLMKLFSLGTNRCFVNSAGHGPRKEILELTDQDWHDGIDTYFLNAVRPIRLVIPVMQNKSKV